MKINTKDIKPGQLIEEYGLITEVDREGNDKFWSGKSNVCFICYHDAYHGTCSAELKHEEFELIEGEERTKWLKQAKEELIAHAKGIQEDLQKIDSIEKENKMEQPLTEVEEVKYVVKVNGTIVSPMYATPHLAEDAIKLLKDEHQSIAEVVSVTGSGQEILLG